MNRILVILAVVLFALNISAQSDKKETELFTNYLGTDPRSSQYLPSKAYIPVETCRAVIAQADQIVSSGKLKTLAAHDLQIASLNLRTCATTSGLTRLDRDLAVGLYGEVVSEQEGRERPTK